MENAFIHKEVSFFSSKESTSAASSTRIICPTSCALSFMHDFMKRRCASYLSIPIRLSSLEKNMEPPFEQLHIHLISLKPYQPSFFSIQAISSMLYHSISVSSLVEKPPALYQDLLSKYFLKLVLVNL